MKAAFGLFHLRHMFASDADWTATAYYHDSVSHGHAAVRLHSARALFAVFRDFRAAERSVKRKNRAICDTLAIRWLPIPLESLADFLHLVDFLSLRLDDAVAKRLDFCVTDLRLLTHEDRAGVVRDH